MTELRQVTSQELLQEIQSRIERAAQPEKETKIISLKITEEKLFAQLVDGRELSIPMGWFAKWGIENVNAEKLRNYEIKRGQNIYFSEIDEVLGLETFIYGFNAPCQ